MSPVLLTGLHEHRARGDSGLPLNSKKETIGSKALGSLWLQDSASRTLESLSTLIDGTRDWLVALQTISRRTAPAGPQSVEMVAVAWSGIVREFGAILQSFELPSKDPSHELLILHRKLLGRSLPQLCPVPSSALAFVRYM